MPLPPTCMPAITATTVTKATITTVRTSAAPTYPSAMPNRCGAASIIRRAKARAPVRRHREAREHAAECRRLQEHEHVLEGRVVRVTEIGDVAHRRQAPREGGEEEQREHERRDEQRRRADQLAQVALGHGKRDGGGAPLHVRTIRVRIEADAPAIPSTSTTIDTRKPSASASPSQPLMISERTPSTR